VTLAPGESLGPYRIEREIGRGGMGIVHLARDSRLDRAVAVKALPEEFAVDPERLARFEREARLLASLHHPNVAGIYGLEENAGRRFLILEYVEGVTLAERLERGALPLDEALDVCRQIALALEAAHEAGIIHRDLKPGNVKLTPSGEVKVLDFGLAKGPAGSASSSDDLTHSPTLTVAATGMGVILGTAGYMSPEQARGRALDRRTDIWSFGAVLFECLTGEQCFAGETVSDAIARILQGEPEWKRLPASTPASVRHLLRRCLEKDARQRLRDIGDARIELEGAIAAMRSGVKPAPEAPAARATRAAWIAGAAIVGAALGAGVLALILALRPSAQAPVVRFPIDLPASVRVAISGTAEPGDWNVSRDGSVMVARVWPRDASPTQQSGPRIYIRALSDSGWRPVPGSELAQGRPGVSDDGQNLFFAALLTPGSQDTRILRVSTRDLSAPVPVFDIPPDVQGGLRLRGRRRVMIEAGGRRFAVGSPDDRRPIAWRAVDAGSFRGAMDPDPISEPDLSADQVFMGTTAYSSDGWHRGLAVLNLRSGKLTPVLTDGQSPALLPSGHLLFSRGQSIFAVRFDRGSLKTRGEAVPVFEGLRARGAWIPGTFHVTERGDLFYAGGGLVGERREVGIVDLSGRMTPITSEVRGYNSTPAVSRDGRWVGVSATNARGIDEMWRIDASDRSTQRLAAVPDADLNGGVMNADGTRLAFTRLGVAGNGLYTMPVSGEEDPAPLLLGGNSTDSVWFAAGWLTGGRNALAVLVGPVVAEPFVIDAHPSDPTRTRRTRLLPGWRNLGGTLSWDGRWLTILNDRSGRQQFYATSVDAEGNAGKPVLVSPSGVQTGWSADNSRIYVQDSTKVKVVRLVNGAPAGPPTTLYDLGPLSERITGLNFLPDGRAVATFRSLDEQVLTRIEVIQNWVSSIRDKLPR
jgi:hypothetical protein